MKAIDQLETLVGDMKSVFAPVLQIQLETLIAQIKAEKPTVVIHIENGYLSGVTTSCEMTAILADYDVNDYDVNDGESKTTPDDYEARIVNVGVECCPEEVAKWMALAS